MSQTIARARRGIILACALSALGISQQSNAGLLFRTQSSTLTLTQDRDVTQADVLVTKSVAPVPASTGIYPNAAYQLNRILTSANGASTAQAVGSLGHVTNATTGSFVLATGTGVAQSDPGNANFPGQSSLKFDVDLRWSVTSGGFGPVATGFASITAGGVVGVGGRADLKINLSFLDGNGAELRSPWRLDAWWTDPGAFTGTFPTSAILGTGTLAEGTTLRIKGTVEFLASNEGGPTKILPLNIESGFTPPTATFQGEGESLLWNDMRNWADPGTGNPGLLGMPDGIGHRARFLNSLSPRDIIITERVTVGTLDVDSDRGHIFLLQPLIAAGIRGAGGIEGACIVFQTQGGPAVLNLRNDFAGNPGLELGLPIDPQNPQATEFTVPLQLDSDLEIHQDSVRQLHIGSLIDGLGGITKLGPGTATLAGLNNPFLGGVIVRQGILNADEAGTLGDGSVRVLGGMLGYNAPRAALHGVIVEANGLVDLGIVPGPGDTFDVRGFGGIRGSAAEMAQFTVGGNLILENNAMIVHEAASPGEPAGLGTVPKYIYGISGDFPALNLTVGAGTPSPWIGFGSGPGVNSIGTSALGGLAFQGNALLVVLGDGILRINSPISGGGPAGTSLRKVGTGVAALQNDNTYPFEVSHEEGTLLVNGKLLGPVVVEKDAILGGVGRIDGAVFLRAGSSRLAPGSPVGVLGDATPVPVSSLTMGSLVMASDAQLDFDFGSTNDLAKVLGDLTLDGVLNILPLDDFGPGVYTLIEFGGIVDNQGLEIGMAPGGYDYRIDVLVRQGSSLGAADSGGTVTLTVTQVPEPASLGLLALGAVALLRRRVQGSEGGSEI